MRKHKYQAKAGSWGRKRAQAQLKSSRALQTERVRATCFCHTTQRWHHFHPDSHWLILIGARACSPVLSHDPASAPCSSRSRRCCTWEEHERWKTILERESTWCRLHSGSCLSGPISCATTAGTFRGQQSPCGRPRLQRWNLHRGVHDTTWGADETVKYGWVSNTHLVCNRVCISCLVVHLSSNVIAKLSHFDAT